MGRPVRIPGSGGRAVIEITTYGDLARVYITDRGAIVRDWIWWDGPLADMWGNLIFDAWSFPVAPRFV